MSSNDPNQPSTQATQGGEPPASTSQNTKPLTWGSGQTSTNTSSSTTFGSTPPTPAASTSSTSSTSSYAGLFSGPKPFSAQPASVTITPTTPTFGFVTPTTSQPSFASAFNKPVETTTGGGTTAVAPFGSSGSIGEKKDNTTATTPSFFGFDANKKTGSGAADTSQKLGETTGGFSTLSAPKQPFGFGTANQSSTEKTTQSGFGFGTANQASSTTAAPTSSTLFGTATVQPSLSSFNAASAPKPFGALGTSNQTTNTGAKPGFVGVGFGSSNPSNQSSTGTTSQSGFSFGSLNQASFNTTASTQPLLGAASTSSTSQSFFGTAPKSQFGNFGNTGQSATTSASHPFGNFRPSSTSNLPASNSGPGLGIGSFTAASASASTSGFGLGIGGTGSLGGAPKTTSAPSPFGTLNKPGGLNTTTNSAGFNLPATTSPSQNINLFSRLGSLPSTQATTAKPFSTFNTSTTTASTSAIFPLSASTTLPSLSVTKPQSIIPQSTSAGFFQTTSSASTTSSQFNLVRPTLQTSASTISFPTGTATTVGATTQSSVATTESIPTSSAWLKNSNIETIINRWKKDLDTSLKKFRSQASELREWDQKIIENSGRIVRLEEESSKADLLQSEIDSGLESIARRQDELEKMLSEYEVKFSEPVLDSTRPLDKQREKNYDMAEEINQELAEMSQVLSTIITDVNRNIIKSPVGDELNGKQEALDQEDIEDPMDEVIKILNSHLTSLQWIDSTANQLTQNVQGAQQILIQAQNELNIQQQQQNGTNSHSG